MVTILFSMFKSISPLLWRSPLSDIDYIIIRLNHCQLVLYFFFSFFHFYCKPFISRDYFSYYIYFIPYLYPFAYKIIPPKCQPPLYIYYYFPSILLASVFNILLLIFTVYIFTNVFLITSPFLLS